MGSQFPEQGLKEKCKISFFAKKGSKKENARKRNAKGQNGCLRRPDKQLRREAKGKGEKERYKHLNQSSKEQQGEIRKPSSVINAKKQRKTIEWEILEISSRKLEIPREYFMQRWAQ